MPRAERQTTRKAAASGSGVGRKTKSHSQWTPESHPIACAQSSVNNPTIPCSVRFRSEAHHRTHRQAVHGVYLPGDKDFPNSLLTTTCRNHLQRMTKQNKIAILVKERGEWNALKAEVKKSWDEMVKRGGEIPEGVSVAVAGVDLGAVDTNVAEDLSLHKAVQLVDGLVEVRTLLKSWELLAKELKKIGFGAEATEEGQGDGEVVNGDEFSGCEGQHDGENVNGSEDVGDDEDADGEEVTEQEWEAFNVLAQAH